MQELYGFTVIDGHLMVGNHRVSDLAKQYQTPLYVMDEAKIRARMQSFKTSFKKEGIITKVCYASKAFLNMAMVQLVHQEGLHLDVVSGGELYTAIQAGFPMSKIVFHGNNKSHQELVMAIRQKVGTIVLDNPQEVLRIESILKPNETVSVLLRVNPGIDAHTHAYIQTTTEDSKFGLSLFEKETEELIDRLARHPQIKFRGLHCHIGSQILETESFIKEVDVLFEAVRHFQDDLKIRIEVLNLGGGFGVKYTQDDQPFDYSSFLEGLLNQAVTAQKSKNVIMPELWIEPGRSIVAEAGLTVYEIGALKTTPSQKIYAFVDGSMADGIRTALYQATYDAVLVDKADQREKQTYTLAGKACESGDILIHACQLASPQVGDYCAVFTTGAYHYSMASHYNRLTTPAVLFVNNDKVSVVIKRETYEDLLAHDVPLQ